MRCMTKPGPLHILYQDRHVLVVNKPAGLLFQGDRTGRPHLLGRIKADLTGKRHFVGMVQRLDRVVSGVSLFALTRPAASALAEDFRKRRVDKHYLAVCPHGPIGAAVMEKTFRGYIRRLHDSSLVVDTPALGAQTVCMHVAPLAADKRLVLFSIKPITGRKHQIRAVMAYLGYPIVGDKKYGSARPFMQDAIALHCLSLAFSHPATGQGMTIEAPLPFYWDSFSLCRSRKW